MCVPSCDPLWLTNCDTSFAPPPRPRRRLLLLFFLFLTCPFHLSSSFLTPAGWQTVVVSWNCGRRGDKVGQRLFLTRSVCRIQQWQSTLCNASRPPATIAARLDSPHASPLLQTSKKQLSNRPDKRHWVENRKRREIRRGQELFMLLLIWKRSILEFWACFTQYFCPHPSTLDGSLAFCPWTVLHLPLTYSRSVAPRTCKIVELTGADHIFLQTFSLWD